MSPVFKERLIPLNLPITFGGGLTATVISAIASPGSISGVWQVDVRMPANQAGAIPISLFVDSVPVRDTNLTIWTRQTSPPQGRQHSL